MRLNSENCYSFNFFSLSLYFSNTKDCCSWKQRKEDGKGVGCGSRRWDAASYKGGFSAQAGCSCLASGGSPLHAPVNWRCQHCAQHPVCTTTPSPYLSSERGLIYFPPFSS